MLDKNGSLHDVPVEPQCAGCKEYEAEVDAYGVMMLVIAFVGPIIGMLSGS